MDLSDNAIREIPEEICLLADKLSTLILYINDLEELPDCICDLRTLTTLWLGKQCWESDLIEMGHGYVRERFVCFLIENFPTSQVGYTKVGLSNDSFELVLLNLLKAHLLLIGIDHWRDYRRVGSHRSAV